jgi:hypothetical protein
MPVNFAMTMPPGRTFFGPDLPAAHIARATAARFIYMSATEQCA